MRLRGGAALLLLVAACGEAPAVRPQWTVTLRTDAPVPLVAERLLVEVTNVDGSLACESCRRLIDASSATAWPISFGIAESPAPLRVRARLYRTRATTPGGAPDPLATIEAVVMLPAAVGPVVVPLRMACFGEAGTSAESCDPSTGALAPIAPAASGTGDPALLPGSWAEASATSCASPAPPGMACVAGGLFFFGDVDPAAVAAHDPLVRVSSFFADRDELSVGRARVLLAANAVVGAPRLHTDDKSATSVCTYRGTQDGSSDAMPLNCVARDLAEALCAAEGKRLLTEAEFAYASANGARGSRYPWGDDDDICAHAVVARDASLDVELTTRSSMSIECRSQNGRTLPFGPVGGDVPTRDQTVDPVGLRNLGGNLAEWVQDTSAPLDDPCWRGRPLLVDPVCRTGTTPTLRGGAWSFPAWMASATFRTSSVASSPNYAGVRCARDAAPR